MKVLILSFLVAVAFSEQRDLLQGLQDLWHHQSVDRIHQYTFEYHKNENLMLIRNSTACIMVPMDANMAAQMEHRNTKEMLEDHLYMQIKADKGETVSDIDELKATFKDNKSVFECFRHDVYKLQSMATMK